MTVIGVPRHALGGERSFDRHERTEIFVYRGLHSTRGLFLDTTLPAIVLCMTGDEHRRIRAELVRVRRTRASTG
jgi:hypothetical protein